MMTTSKTGYDLIKESEGLRLKSYQDTVNKWTIGYGHTFGVRPGQTITEIVAEDLLKNDVRQCEIDLNKLNLNLNQNQYDALIDFLFNIGITKFLTSRLYSKVKKNPNDTSISTELKKWVYGLDGSHNGLDDDGDGIVDEPGEKGKAPGLIKRRTKEAELYFNKN